jgi:hypothetical protein
MALALKVYDHWDDGKRIHLIATITASGSYPAGGDVIPLSDPLIKSGSAPVVAIAQGLGGFNYVCTVGGYQSTAQPRSVLRVFVDTTGLELGAGAYPAGILTNPISFYAIFFKFI